MVTPRRAGVARFGLLAQLVLVACGGSSDSPVDASSQPCAPGAQECRADGVYACNAAGVFDLQEACTDCDAAPTPHCPDACGPGVTSVCDGDSIRACAGSQTLSCAPGVCMQAGTEAVCTTSSGMSTCSGQRADGMDYTLLCADETGIANDQACDVRTGKCVSTAYSCPALQSVPDGQVTCDAATGDLFTSCYAGQPLALACPTGSKCASDGTTNCYTPPTEGVSCGGAIACYPGLHCTQTAASTSTCVQPAGQLACSSTDVLLVCNDSNTGVACVDGLVWWWKNLSSWGGACTNNHVSLGAGGTCIPGLADCKLGLACKRSPFDVAGVCGTPAPNAPADCTLTNQLSTGTSCAYAWQSCLDGHYYGIACQLTNIGGNIVTLCNCSVDGTNTGSFGGDEICNVSSTEMLDATAMQECGWDVRTTDVAP